MLLTEFECIADGLFTGGANAHVIIEEAPRRADVHANGVAVANGHANGHALNGSANGYTNGHANGSKATNGHTNGHANGFSINCHSNETSNSVKATSQTTLILPLSAATGASLEQRKADYASHDFGNTSMTDLAYTLGYKRTHFPERGFFIASRNDDIANVFKTGTLVTSPRPAPTSQSLPFAFVFTGQGSQWPGMCKQLFAEFDIFRNAIEEMDHVLKAIPHAPEWSLVDAILETDDPTLIHRPERSQPCCTAIQVGLVRLLESWGLMPTTTVGHSSGEIAAAFAAGYLSAAEAIVIAYYRGYCAARNTQIGAMMAVGLSEEKANEAIADAGLEGQVCVACVNSPEGVTVSGDQEPLDTLLASLQGKSIFARKLKTGGQAYHSHHMAVLGPKYQALLDQVLPTLGPSISQPSGAALVSTVTGAIKASGFDSAYWRRNLESQVRFSPAIASIHSMAEHFFIELGPHTSMGMPIEQTLAKAGAELKYAGPIKRSSDSVVSALSFAGQLWFQGFEVNWAKVNNLIPAGSKTMPRVVTDLPPYKFDYGETLWNESRASIEYRQRKYPRHELLGSLVPGGNARDFIFRNVLKVDDVSWLKDHKLVDTIVFPGAGYLCMAMEAASQASDESGPETTFELTNVNITNALPLDEESSVELFTSLHRAPITNAATSDIWWDWTVTSHTNGQSTTHASGSIAVHTEEHILGSKYAPPQDTLETTHKRVWYERFVKSGLNYGPTFESISSFQTPRLKNETFASATAPLLTTSGDPLAVYPVHPITLDALIQLAIVSTAKGVPKEMRALVPTRLSSVRVKRSNSAAEAQLNARTDRTGFGYCQADAELIDAAGQVTAQLEGFRLAPYSSAAQGEDADDARHPVLRVLWKPDVHGLGLMTASAAQEYAQKFADEAHSPVEDTDLLKLGAMLDLFAHKDPVLRILEVGNGSQDLTLAVLELLKSQTDFKRLATYTTAQLNADGAALVGGAVNLETGERAPKAEAINGQYDLILCLTKDEAMVGSLVAQVPNLMTANAYILSLCPSAGGDGVITSQGLETLPVSITKGQPTLVLARKPQSSHVEILKKRKSKYLIVEREKTKLGSALGDALRSVQGHWVSRVRLEDLTIANIPRNTTVFNLCELKTPLLSVCTDEEMAKIKLITDNASSLIWTTNANTLEGERPDFALISGLSRALMLEQPSLKLFTYDIDSPDEFVSETADRLIALLTQPEKKIDYEFVQRNNVAHVSRFVPDDSVNGAFRSKQGLTTETRPLSDAGDARLSVGEAGQLDSIYFIQQDPEKQMIGPEEVRIKVASVGINAKDYYVLVGRVDTPDATCQLECAGTVVAVGSAVTDFAAGDRVVAMAPSYFGTYQTLPQWACYKLAEGESFDVAATLPLVYATAIYALQHRAQIQPGESVLIHSGAGGVGIAAIQLALRMGAEVCHSL
jgi:acyl transferase domain-containing protein